MAPANTSDVGPPIHVPTIIALACVTYAVSTMLHEGAHAITGWAVGGRPTLISTTDVRGDWSGVSPLGFTAIGVGGSLVNWLVACCAAWFGRRGGARQASTKWFAWLMLAVNGFVPAMYMIVSPLLGFGDWMTVLGRWPGTLAWRAVIVSLGLGLTWWWIRVTGRRLAEMIGRGLGASGFPLAYRLALISWLSGGALAVTAALFSPLGLAWAVGIGMGSALGTTWPMLPVARRASKQAAANGITAVGRHRGWIAAGALAALVFVAVFGRGVVLG